MSSKRQQRNKARAAKRAAAASPAVATRGDADLAGDDDSLSFDNIWFVSDVSYSEASKKISDHLSPDIHNYDSKHFANRTPSELRDTHNLTHIWTSVRDDDALAFLSQYIAGDHGYTVIVVHRDIKGAKNQKWIENVEDFTDMKMRLSDLACLDTLSFGEFMTQLKTRVRISKPASGIGSFLGISNRLKKTTR